MFKIMCLLHGTIYSENLTTLRTFFTMALDDVLPFSDLLSDNLLQLFDDYESSSSTASLTVPVPAPPPEMDSACLHLLTSTFLTTTS